MRTQLIRGGFPERSRTGSPGVALVLALLLVGLLLVMALSLISVGSSDFDTAKNETLSIQALFNAEGGVEESRMRVSKNAPTADKIEIGTSADWRAYIYSGALPAPSEAQMKSAISALEGPTTYGKKWLDTTSNTAATDSEGDTNYKFYNTIQTAGSDKINWGWARITHKFLRDPPTTGTGKIVYLDVTTFDETFNATKTVGAQTVNNLPILVLTSEGIQGPVRRMIQMQLNPVVNLTTNTTIVVTDPFSSAAHGKTRVVLNGVTYTDSYNSGVAPYGSSATGTKGDVSTDSVAAAAITLNGGNTTINGQALVGPGGDTSTAISGATPTNVTQGIGIEPNVWNIPPATIPTSGVTDLGIIDLSGQKEMTLAAGVYRVTKFNLSGQAKLNLTGKVILYVDGPIDIVGQGVSTANNLPPNFMVYGTANCTSVKVSGNGAFYGALYAPAAAITTNGGGTVFGALTGNTVDVVGGGTFHYDEALGEVDKNETTTTTNVYSNEGFVRKYWREVPF